MMATSRRWKRHESECAKALGTTRNPTDGKHHTDVDAGPFAIEHKLRKHLPQLLHDAMAQAIQAAPTDKTPMVVLTESRQGVKAIRYVVMRFEDWVDWHGKPEDAAEAILKRRKEEGEK